MRRLRFTLAQLMAVVFVIGIGFAALRHADWFWASATYHLAIMMVGTAVIGAVTRKGRSRATWAGFAVFGSIYLAGAVSRVPARLGSLLEIRPRCQVPIRRHLLHESQKIKPILHFLPRDSHWLRS